MLARLAAAALSFGIPLALARAFPQAEYGTYKLLVVVAQTLYYVLPFGMAQSLYYFLPRVSNRRAWLSQTLGYLFLAGVAGALALWLGRHTLGRLLNNEGIETYALQLGLYTMGLVGSMPLEVSQTARGMTRRAAWTYVISDALKAAVMTLPAVLGFGLKGVMAGMAAFALLRLAATWIVLLRGEPGPAWDLSGVRAQLRYALPFGLAMAVAIPQQYFHQFVVSSRLDAATFALYAVGVFQLPIIDLVYTPTSEVLMVRIAELEREGRPEAAAAAFREAVGNLAQLFLPLSVFLVVVAPEFIAALFTARYLGSVPVFRVVSLSVVLACAPLDGVLRARDQTAHILKSYLVKAAVNVPLVLLGVAHFGMMGGVLAWLLAEIAGKAALASRVPQALGVPGKVLLPWSELTQALSASLLALGGVFAARVAVGPGAAPALLLVADAAGFALGYLCALVAVGASLPFGWALPWRSARAQ
ncbi:MAG TPA: oligosaccharide flippase family protein [Myxococcales bacterium]|jgi:O-antigen/teichoic acid export membrane protein